jgi:predicted component of type VI protein secretion system
MIPETLSEAQEISLQSNTLKDMIFKNVTKNICWITMMLSANQSLNDLKPFLN